MAKEKGTKNKPKNAQNLLDRVVEEYKKQGKTLSYSLADMGDLTEEQKVEIAKAATENPNLNIANIFELQDNPEEGNQGDDNLYECGQCHSKLDGEDAQCPHCRATLRWT